MYGKNMSLPLVKYGEKNKIVKAKANDPVNKSSQQQQVKKIQSVA